MLREDKNRFDVLGNDLQMHEMDGLQLLKIIRSEMDLPVVSKFSFSLLSDC
jgi:CheY-like chemotaxis protein